jgi:hypothetical protein
MDRRHFFVLLGSSGVALAGCRSQPVGEVIKDGKKDAVGSTAAGAEAYKPMIDESLGKLLARQATGLQPAGGNPAPKAICFVGLENASSEDLGDWKEQIIETIDNKINTSGAFVQISRRFTDAGLQATRLRPNELFLGGNMKKFQDAMAQQGAPFDYLLFAKLTSGTTRTANASQKDYLLTLELVNIQTGIPEKESATIRKGYSRSRF